jgi:hypothetical protein
MLPKAGALGKLGDRERLGGQRMRSYRLNLGAPLEAIERDAPKPGERKWRLLAGDGEQHVNL